MSTPSFFRLSQIQLPKSLAAEVEVVDSFFGTRRWPERNVLSHQRVGYFQALPKHSQLPIPSYPRNSIVRPIFNRRQALRISVQTWNVTCGRCRHPQCFMRPFVVSKAHAIQDLAIQAAMEAFIFAIGLWMIGAAVADAYSQPNHPYRQLG